MWEGGDQRRGQEKLLYGRKREDKKKGMVNSVGGVDRERVYDVLRGTWHEL